MNKHIKYTALFAALVLALAACPTDAGDDDDDDDNGLPALTGTVSISGNEGIDQTLTADTTALDGDGAISYQWYKGDTPMSGKTEAVYIPDEADRGKTLLVKVRRAGYTGVVASNPTGEIGDYIPGKKTLNVSVAPGEAKFYSLATGLEVSNPASADWDIGFAATTANIAGGRMLLTNSGDTATKYGALGDGGIYPADSTDFIAVTLADKKEGTINGVDYTLYHTDKKRYVSIMGVAEVYLNAASYPGFSNETTAGAGLTQEAPLSGLTAVGTVYGSCFWYRTDMSAFVPTKQVYIVKHADGVKYSAVQVQNYIWGVDDETYTVVIKPLE